MIIKNQNTGQKKQYSKFFFKKWFRRGLMALFVIILFFIFLQPLKYLNPHLKLNTENSFFSESITVEIQPQSVLGKSQIRYTLDGSTPTAQSQLYQTPLEISKTLILKAAIFKNDQVISPIISHNFFINDDHQLPVVAINTDPDNLWDAEIGIYVEGNHHNSHQHGKKWQREAEFVFFDEKQQLQIKQKIGLRIHGGGTRSLPQKSFRIYADPDDQGQTLSYKFFPDSELENFESLTLRNGGTDWEYSFMRDAVVNNLASKISDVDSAPAQPIVLYLNSQYWGIYYLRERFDETYFAQKYKADEENLAIYQVPHDVGEKRGQIILDEGKSDQDVQLYNDLLKEARKCKECAHYNHFKKYIDMESFIDYMIFEIHFANFDWPYGNMKLWNYHNNLVDQSWDLSQELPQGLDGRFRWLLYDLDVGFGFGSENHEEMRKAAQNGDYGYLIDDGFPFRNFFYDPTFQENYFNRYANLLNTGLSSDSVLKQIECLESLIQPEIPRQVDRWKDHISPHDNQQFQSVEDWQYQVALLKTYAEYRADYMRQNTLDYFPETFHDDEMIRMSLDVNDKNGGDIQVHQTVYPGVDMPFSGLYFPHLSINIEALPKKGFKFSHWEGDVYPAQRKRQKLRLHLDENLNLTAVFVKTGWL